VTPAITFDKGTAGIRVAKSMRCNPSSLRKLQKRKSLKYEKPPEGG
jgi:hypothetical protein